MRLSTKAGPVTVVVPASLTTVPRTTSAISASVIAIIARPAPRAALRGRRREVSSPPTTWPVSWPLPATTHGVARAGHADHQPDGVPALAHLVHLGPLARRHPSSARQHLRPDAGRVLGARVVVGDDQHVGPSCGELAHDRSLALVAVAAGTEHHHQPTRGQWPQRRDDRGDRVRLVRVVDHRQEVLPAVDLLEATRHSARAAHGLGHRGGIETRLSQSGYGTERVRDVEVPGERHPRRERLTGRRVHGERGARRLEAYVDSAPVRLGAEGGERAHGHRALADEAAAVGVVDVDEGAPRALRSEQRRLRRVVVLDVGVEVQVVATQVGEAGDVEHDTVDAAHDQRVARDLHRARHDLVLDHHREQRVQVGCLGGGQ